MTILPPLRRARPRRPRPVDGEDLLLDLRSAPPCQACGHRRIFHLMKDMPVTCSLCGCRTYRP